MNVAGFDFIEIPVTHEGEGLQGVVRALNTAGYYATITGNAGDVIVLYGPRGEHLRSRVPYVALLGDTIIVSDRSKDECQNKH